MFGAMLAPVALYLNEAMNAVGLTGHFAGDLFVLLFVFVFFFKSNSNVNEKKNNTNLLIKICLRRLASRVWAISLECS